MIIVPASNGEEEGKWDSHVKCSWCLSMSATHAGFCLHPAALCSFGCSLVLHTCLFYLEARDLASLSVPSTQQRASSTAGLVDACRAEAGEAGLL